MTTKTVAQKKWHRRGKTALKLTQILTRCKLQNAPASERFFFPLLPLNVLAFCVTASCFFLCVPSTWVAACVPSACLRFNIYYNCWLVLRTLWPTAYTIAHTIYQMHMHIVYTRSLWRQSFSLPLQSFCALFSAFLLLFLFLFSSHAKCCSFVASL